MNFLEFEQPIAELEAKIEELKFLGSDAGVKISDEVKNAANAYRESWNRTADPFIGKVRDVAEGAASAAEGLFDRIGRRGGGGGQTREN